MPKGKSSASSATRKKHARKAGPAPQEPLPKEKKPKGKDKNLKKEPRQKIYIPPVKPAPIQPDPLDTTGLAHQLPPDLLVVLRRFGKKDAVTKRRALEELQGAWVDKCGKEGDDSPLVPTLVLMQPVWVRRLNDWLAYVLVCKPLLLDSSPSCPSLAP
jgi:E3 ubiquitin-protein ligase listerin